MEQKDLAGVGGDILLAARNELYLHLPYLDAAPRSGAVSSKR